MTPALRAHLTSHKERGLTVGRGKQYDDDPAPSTTNWGDASSQQDSLSWPDRLVRQCSGVDLKTLVERAVAECQETTAEDVNVDLNNIAEDDGGVPAYPLLHTPLPISVASGGDSSETGGAGPPTGEPGELSLD